MTEVVKRQNCRKDQDFRGSATELFVILSTKAGWKEPALSPFEGVAEKLVNILD